MGLVTHAEDAEEVLPTAMRLARAIAGSAPMAVQQMKASIRRSLGRDIRAAAREEAGLDTASATKFVVSDDNVFGIDAGACDPAVVAEARSLLQGGEAAVSDGMFYEPVLGSDFNIAVFGAGHVGAAVVKLLSGLDCNIRWIDSRRDIFRSPPRNVKTVEASEPALEVAAMPPHSYYLVMTHSHPLDFDICDRILRRGDAAYCGLIGSLTKRRRFDKRFREQGLSQGAIEQLVCPIGVTGINGKKPAEIAIAVAAEILRVYEKSQAAAGSPPGNVHPAGS